MRVFPTREKFFKLLGIEDDRRNELLMTDAEYNMFCRNKPMIDLRYVKDKDMTLYYIYFTFLPYEDYSAYYNEENNTIYFNLFYIGD